MARTLILEHLVDRLAEGVTHGDFLGWTDIAGQHSLAVQDYFVFKSILFRHHLIQVIITFRLWLLDYFDLRLEVRARLLNPFLLAK